MIFQYINFDFHGRFFPPFMSVTIARTTRTISRWADGVVFQILIPLKHPPFILRGLRTNGGAVEIIGDLFPFVLSLSKHS
jgi:hypothetical protein